MCKHAAMPGKRGSGRQLDPLPDDLAPELRRLAECLRSHFDDLEMSIRTYSDQVPWDAGTVSRFLSGKIVASRDFVDRLVADAGTQHTPEQIEQDSAQAQDLRTNALQVRNTKAAESERIAEELREAEEEIKLFRARERLITKELERANDQYQLLLEQYRELQRSQDLENSSVRQIENRQVARDKDAAEEVVNRLRHELEVERSARIDAVQRRDALQAELDRNRTELLRSGGSSAPAALYGSHSTLMSAIRDRRNHWGNWIAVFAIPVVVFGTPIYLGLIFRALNSRDHTLKIITVCSILVPVWLALEALRTSRRGSDMTSRHLWRIALVMAALFVLFAFI